jgi:hypothetical protein
MLETVDTATVEPAAVEPVKNMNLALVPVTAQTKMSQALIPLPTPTVTSLVSSTVPSLEQGQREAIADLLLLGIHSDKVVGFNELEFLNNEMVLLQWDEFHSPDIYLQQSTPGIRAIAGHDEKRARLLRDISQRLSDVEVMKFAIERFSTLLTLGGRVAVEGILLDQVMEIFFAEA